MIAKLKKEGYLKHLGEIRNQLLDFLELIKKGKIHYIKDVALKLRILYLKKSGTKPLLLTISELYNFKISVYSGESLESMIKKLPRSENVIFQQRNSVLSWFKNDSKLTNIFDALDKPDVKIGAKTHSYKRIIEVVADKMGGAHIDKNVDNEDLILHSKEVLIGGMTSAQRAIFDTARITIMLINMILELIENNKENLFIKKIT